MRELPALLAAFHSAFRADSVYGAHRLAYRAYIADYNSALRREVSAAMRYMRVSRADELRIPGASSFTVVVPNLLMAYDRSISFTVGDTTFVVEGPSAVVGYDARGFIQLATASLTGDTAQFGEMHSKATPVYLAAKEAHDLTGIETLESFIDANLVRAIALRIRIAHQPERDAEFRSQAEEKAKAGLLLVPYFYEQLEKFESQRQSLRSYYPQLFEGLDAVQVIARSTGR